MRLAIVCLAVAACANVVRQDRATGKNGRFPGARVMARHGDAWITRGIVTYPGGDRVDWHRVALPGRGSVAIELHARTPRPDLRVTFDVFDAWYTAFTPRVRNDHGTRRLEIEASGELFIRVFAVRRGDAGAYTLRVTFAPAPVRIDPASLLLDVPDPPDLPAVPAAPNCNDGTTFDDRPPCRPLCTPDGPPGWPGCTPRCPNPPDIAIAACWATMPCPDPPDPRVARCTK